MTLTTEQLRARAESLGMDFFIERRAGIWVKEWLNDGCTSATAEEVMMWSMLAHREAQPVIVVGDDGGDALAYRRLIQSFAPGTKLYAAPPAPEITDEAIDRIVVPLSLDGLDEEKYPCEWHLYHDRERIRNELRKYFAAPPAPAVPDGYCVMPLTLTAANGAKGALSGEFKVSRTVRCHECGGEGCDDCGDTGEFEEETTVPWDTIKDIYRAAVDACRAAMLAQPVSSGYKLPDGFKLMPLEMTDEIGEAIAMEARCCGGIALDIYQAALAAAPEGGN